MSKKNKRIETSVISNNVEVLSVNDVYGSALVEKLRKASQQQSTQLGNSFACDVIDTPLPFYDMAHFVLNNTWHSRCVELKAAVAVSPGWEAVHRDKSANKKTSTEPVRSFLENAIGKTNKILTPENFFNSLSIDIESLGNAYIEVVRGATGKPEELYHVPSLTVRKRQGNLKAGSGYWQLTFLSRTLGESAYTNTSVPQPTKETYNLFGGAVFTRVFFKEYGDTDEYDILGNRHSDGTTIPEEMRANEMIHIKRYHPLSPFYGIPTWISCFTSIIGDEAAEKWNLAFFENNRVPRWMFVLSGANLSNEARDDIKKHFSEILRSRPHAPMVIANPSPNMKVETHKLETESNEASFLDYRKASRDEIIASHGVPPRMLGVITPGQLGGVGDSQSQREDFKEFTIKPLQNLILEPINRLILPDAGFRDYEIALNNFNNATAEEFEKMCNACVKVVSNGVMTINEARKKLGLKEIDKAWANEHFFIHGETIMTLNNKTIEVSTRDSVDAKKLEQDLSASKEKVKGSGRLLREDEMLSAIKDSSFGESIYDDDEDEDEPAKK